MGCGLEVLLDLLRHRSHQELRRFGAEQVKQPGLHDLVVPGFPHGAGQPLEFRAQ